MIQAPAIVVELENHITSATDCHKECYSQCSAMGCHGEDGDNGDSVERKNSPSLVCYVSPRPSARWSASSCARLFLSAAQRLRFFFGVSAPVPCSLVRACVSSGSVTLAVFSLPPVRRRREDEWRDCGQRSRRLVRPSAPVQLSLRLVFLAPSSLLCFFYFRPRLPSPFSSVFIIFKYSS
ncbi:uncharacterized protein LOC114762404 [Neltuma alba]|uniref:uncharacterized protein LOC114762404 n=1 Tax=Neltuma alba TaxID=207710 RepID=UPI0010A425B3|nr:uncharacterized protein LOC114762404 [Prosopis alba]